MNILISNDDGIFAEGIKKLAEGLSLVEDVRLYICAPDTERSNIGHGITVRSDLYLTECSAERFGPKAEWAAACSGTPADCVRIALSILEGRGIKTDLVCAGINNGLNTGTDINYSGTIAACREAVIDGVPAMAFSSSRGLVHADNFLRIVPEIFTRFAGKLPQDTILNVNAMDKPWEDIRGYRAAGLSINTYPPWYLPAEDEESVPGRKRYTFNSYSLKLTDRTGTADTTLLKEGYVSVSLIPLLPDAASCMQFVSDLLPRTQS